MNSSKTTNPAHLLPWKRFVAGFFILITIFVICALSLLIQDRTKTSNKGEAKNKARLADSPSLSFAYDTNKITFDDLNKANSWTDTKTSTFTASANNHGYTVQAYIIKSLSSSLNLLKMIDSYHGTWDNPKSWTSGTSGFGYTSSDTSVRGLNRFNNGTKYAAFSSVFPGDIIADSFEAVESEEFDVTYKIVAPDDQAASGYQTYVIYIVTSNY